MQKKVDAHIFAGMQKDMAISKHKNEFLYDAYNIRFTPMEGNTMMSITNERGPKYQLACEGKYVGHCVIDKYLVLFTKKIDGTDRIVRFEPNTSNTETILYEGSLNFQLDHPLETLGVYENENIIKVYWVDGVNQPRVINITRDANSEHPYITGLDTQFDFTPTLQLRESISVERIDGAGMFAPGVIQYAFSYYNLFGQQSNIFYTTPLNYISFTDRGGSGDDKCANSFRIIVNNVDTNFDYLRVYAIQRTSLNGQATGRRVADLKINGQTLTLVDNGELGDSIDTLELLYIGGDIVNANTLAVKDNTLFVANYATVREEPFPFLKDFSEDITNIDSYLQSKIINREGDSSGYYFYTNQLKNLSSGFKNREHYRLGFQLQHKSGKWSTPYFLTDYTVDSNLNPSLLEESDKVTCNTIALHCSLDLSQYIDGIRAKDYVKIRPVCVFPSYSDRLVLTQGLLCPTIFNYAERTKGEKFAQASWFFRLNPPEDVSSARYSEGQSNTVGDAAGGGWIEFRHMHSLRAANTFGGEIIGDGGQISHPRGSTRWTSTDADRDYIVDQSILTLHSPEVEFDNGDVFNSLKSTSWKLRLVGLANFTSVKSDSDITVSIPGGTFQRYKGGYHDTDLSIKGLVDGGLWSDFILTKHETEDGTAYIKNDSNKHRGSIRKTFMIYPWHKEGALNNDDRTVATSDQVPVTSTLKSKTIANFRFSKNNTWFNYNSTSNALNYNITALEPFNSKEVSLLSLPNQDSARASRRFYLGNEDTIIEWEDDKYSSVVINSDKTITTLDALVEKGDIELLDGIDMVNPERFAVRISYKSTPHLVFGLTTVGGNDENTKHQPIILPSVNNLNTVDISKSESWYFDDPYQVNVDNATGDYVVIDYSYYRGQHPKSGGYYSLLEYIDLSSTQNLLETNIEKYNNTIWIDFDDTGVVLNHPYKIYCIIREERDNDVLWVAHNLTSNVPTQEYLLYEDPVVPKLYQRTMDDSLPGSDTIVYVNFISFLDGREEEGDLASTAYKVQQRDITVDNLNYPYLFLGELYRDPLETDFGGPIDMSYLSNLWLPAGEPINISDNVTLDYTYGDTWYQRYDCLKTYPFTEEHINNIIEVGSFLCETRVNIDGRYDKKRGQLGELLTFSPDNFNNQNEVYNQSNSFFNYRILDKPFYDLNYFPNQITWTLEKLSGSIIDNWTSINLATTLDVNGTKGKISKLQLYRDSLLCFQDSAINNIMFNSRVQIPTTDGVPIEISNSGKMDGSRIISDSIGCSNKWSICTTPNALYFMDDNSRKLYAFSDKLQTISDTHGFDHHFKSIENFDSEHTFYDPIRQDVYLVWDSQCLVWSELLGQFTSFMSYENVPAMFNIGDKFYSIYFSREWNPDPSPTSPNGYVQHDSFINLYEMFKGGYNRFFGIIYPSHITFVSNPDGSTDKIFSTLGARLDVFSDNPESTEAFKNLQHKRFFDYIQVSNEYQDTGKVPLAQSWIKPASHGTSLYNVKKKFRQWRVDIPRDTLDNEHRLNRIRNTWAKISLGFDPPVNPHILTQEELLAYASANNIENFDIAAYYEQISGNPLEHATSERAEHEAPLSPEVEAAIEEYKKMHYILHDVDVQYFV